MVLFAAMMLAVYTTAFQFAESDSGGSGISHYDEHDRCENAVEDEEISECAG